MKLMGSVFGALILLCLPAHSQGQFVNLGFEQANPTPLNPNDPGRIDAASALPGWTVYQDSTPINMVLHNAITIGSGAVTLVGPDFTQRTPYRGNYYVKMYPGPSFVPGQDLENPSYAIAQYGTIPADSRSIMFIGMAQGATISFNENEIPYSFYLPAQAGAIYAGDISAYAGQSGLLKISVDDYLPHDYIEIDRIVFSPTVVPEPKSTVLFLGALALAASGRLLKRRFERLGNMNRIRN